VPTQWRSDPRLIRSSAILALRTSEAKFDLSSRKVLTKPRKADGLAVRIAPLLRKHAKFASDTRRRKLEHRAEKEKGKGKVGERGLRSGDKFTDGGITLTQFGIM
jgi:hypothetical protein